MMQILTINRGRIKKTALVLISHLMFISIYFAESKVIIEGNSSIIIESQSKVTKLFIDTVETKTDGKFLENIISNNSNDDIGFNVEVLPESFILEKAYPNPFNPTTNIKYGLDKTYDIDIAIYDLTGRLVNNIRINDQSPGWHEFTWRGTDSFDQNVCTGIYLITMRAGENIQRQKVTYLK